jgi:hypothetical protein
MVGQMECNRYLWIIRRVHDGQPHILNTEILQPESARS